MSGQVIFVMDQLGTNASKTVASIHCRGAQLRGSESSRQSFSFGPPREGRGEAVLLGLSVAPDGARIGVLRFLARSLMGA